MSMGLILIIALGIFFLLMAMEVPISFCLTVAGAVGVWLTRGLDIANSVLGGSPFTSVANYSLAIVPMYIMVGMFALFANIADNVFEVADHLMKKIRGGLGLATIAACAGFAAVTGSSVATAATIGKLSINEMIKRGYSPRLATGIVAASGTLGILIPPSIILAIYGVLTRESIASLLLAGIIPGAVSAIIYMVYVFIKGIKGADRLTLIQASDSHDTTSKIARLLKLPWRGVFRVVILFGIVMIGVYSGIFTVTESGALAAFAALIFLIYELRKKGLKGMLISFKEAIKEVASITSMSFFIFIGSSVFTFYLVTAGVPVAFTNWVISLNVPPSTVVMVLLLALIPLGMALDSLSVVVIFVPLTYPIVTALGFSGIWYGILVVKGIELGQITPPVGINVYVVSGVSRIEPAEVFKGILPFTILDIITAVILFIFPQIILWLPTILGG